MTPATNMSNLHCCTGLTNLRELSLEGCEELSSVASLSGMRKLRALNLRRCSAVGGLQHLSGPLLKNAPYPPPCAEPLVRMACMTVPSLLHV